MMAPIECKYRAAKKSESAAVKKRAASAAAKNGTARGNAGRPKKKGR
jgi:hypothetical protein